MIGSSPRSNFYELYDQDTSSKTRTKLTLWSTVDRTRSAGWSYRDGRGPRSIDQYVRSQSHCVPSLTTHGAVGLVTRLHFARHARRKLLNWRGNDRRYTGEGTCDFGSGMSTGRARERADRQRGCESERRRASGKPRRESETDREGVLVVAAQRESVQPSNESRQRHIPSALAPSPGEPILETAPFNV